MTLGTAGMLFLLAVAGDEQASVQLTAESTVQFAAPDEGRRLLTAADTFVTSLSRFDLQCRLKTDAEVSIADWKQLVSHSILPWDEAAIDAVSSSLDRLKKRLVDIRLPLSPRILLVHTTGDEEGNAAYTRGTAIVLPTKVLSYPPTQLDRLLAHELFHIASRHDGAQRAKLYRIIGFEPCEPIELPGSLADRRITNPDAPLINCTIELTAANGKILTAAPVLYASAKQFDSQRGGSIFQYLTFRLLVVEQRGGKWQPSVLKGEPVVIDPRKEPAFLDKVGKNTNYIIHPDEILADNFVRLVMGDKEVPTPRIIDEMRKLLAR